MNSKESAYAGVSGPFKEASDRNPIPPIANFTLPATSFVSLRAGMSFGDFSIEPFIDNLTDTHVPINYNRSVDPGTGDSRLLREIIFRPRTFGVTFTYKH